MNEAWIFHNKNDPGQNYIHDLYLHMGNYMLYSKNLRERRHCIIFNHDDLTIKLYTYCLKY